MLSLTEWLIRVGFQGGNPFALKQADSEGELLQEYFVEHPAYNAMLDIDNPRSSVLYAPRGAGKSSMRRMFEQYCIEQAAHFQVLVVHLTDWMTMVERVGSMADLQPRDYLQEIFRQTVVALMRDSHIHQMHLPQSSDMAGYLRWICQYHSEYLLPGQRRVLYDWGWMSANDDHNLADYDISTLPVDRSLRLLMDVLRSLGYRTCYILVDRIDEFIEAASDWKYSADLLAPLIGNLHIIEIPQLAFKFFIPLETVNILRQRHLLREDRIGCFALSGDPHLLKEILRARLIVFSDGLVSSLASLAEPNIRDVDDQLSFAAGGCPRRLLNLSESVIQQCAYEADDDNLLIRRHHVECTLQRFQTHDATGSTLFGDGELTDTSQPETPPVVSHPITPDQPSVSTPLDVPIFRIHSDGSIWRGNREIDGWRDLPPLQRSLIEYLYRHRGTLCRKQDIIDHIWHDRPQPAGDDSLRKLVKRVIAFVEPNPDQPVYINKIRGGHYRLDHTSD